MSKTPVDLKELYADCKLAQSHSYAPYSKANVGACLYTKDGKKIYGCNVENASYGLTMCAERNCLFSSVTQGVKKEDILILGISANFKDYAWPCGACRQVMSEMMDLKTPVAVFNNEGKAIVLKVEELLPYTFTSEDLK